MTYMQHVHLFFNQKISYSSSIINYKYPFQLLWIIFFPLCTDLLQKRNTCSSWKIYIIMVWHNNVQFFMFLNSSQFSVRLFLFQVLLYYYVVSCDINWCLKMVKKKVVESWKTDVIIVFFGWVISNQSSSRVAVVKWSKACLQYFISAILGSIPGVDTNIYLGLMTSLWHRIVDIKSMKKNENIKNAYQRHCKKITSKILTRTVVKKTSFRV
jgi:hypothetical protein